MEEDTQPGPRNFSADEYDIILAIVAWVRSYIIHGSKWSGPCPARFWKRQFSHYLILTGPQAELLEFPVLTTSWKTARAIILSHGKGFSRTIFFRVKDAPTGTEICRLVGAGVPISL